MHLEALAGRFAVDLVIVPVAGPASDLAWATALARSVVVVTPVDDETARKHVTAQLADATLRRRLRETAPLPARVAAAPPTLADDALRLLDTKGSPPRAVFVLRNYLAPFGCTLARRLESPRVVVDLDDDDENFGRSMGDDEEADAVARLARVWLPDADVLCAASADEARTIATRYGLTNVATIPNAVRPAPTIPPPPGDRRLLFVGNLTYSPNLEAAHILVHEILPIVRTRYPEATVDLVGPHTGNNALEADHVRVAGLVDSVEPWYRGADVVVVPLRHGGGTRIKVLEAFAYRRPVVATACAVAGLAVTDGSDVLVAESAGELARHILELFDDGERGARLVQHATHTFDAHYSLRVISPLVCNLVEERPLRNTRATGGGRA
jgi:glycosyltransferase involved in cell wall biosynthesis